MDVQTIFLYILGIVFNTAVVALFRVRVMEAGKQWLQSGRFAVFAVFILAFLELLITGKFEALQDPQSFLTLINTAWAMAGGSVGTHTFFKGVNRALGSK